jgi:dTDP-4-dehydrorhamnose reductase
MGWELERALPALGEVIATDRKTLDLVDRDAICRVVRDVKPTLIVNAAAYTAVDRAESERDLAMQVNTVAPCVLAEEAKRLCALLVHFSTDYVFDGEKRRPYTESDEPGPLSHYASTKLEGERGIVASACRHLIMRTSWVYGPRAANFYQIILRKAAAGEPMLMVDDQTSVPTPSAFLAATTKALVRKGAEGLLHVVPSGAASRYELAQEVVRAMGSLASVTPVGVDRFPSPARRPIYSVLDNRRAAAMLGHALPDWKKLLSLTPRNTSQASMASRRFSAKIR